VTQQGFQGYDPYRVTLPYLAAGGGDGSLPLTPANAHVLNQAAEFAAGAKLLRTNGITDIILGALFLVLGVAMLGAAGVGQIPTSSSIWFPLAFTALGAILLATGLWTYLRPGPTAMVVDGVVLFLLFGFNLVLHARDFQDGKRPGVFSFLILIILFSAGMSRFRNVKRFKQAAETPLSTATIQWLQRLQKDVARAKSATDPALVTFTATGWPPVSFRGRLLEGLAVGLINGKLRFLTQDQLRISDPETVTSGKLTKVGITLDGRALTAQVPTSELPRLLAWRTAARAAAQQVIPPPLTSAPPPPIPPAPIPQSSAAPAAPMYSPLMPPPPPPFT
jgi:hypothetical protein